MDMMLAYDHSPAVFKTIESLHDATEKFEAKDGFAFVELVLKPLILKYNLAKDFGVILVHRHFDIDDSTILVEKDSTAAPWKLPNKHMNKDGGVISSSWTIKDSVIYPYEFRFVQSQEGLALIENNLDFAEEFFGLVYEHGLAGYIGLRRVPIDPKAWGETLECTEGNVNIVFREGELSREYLSSIETTPTMWFFNQDPPHNTYRCSCQKYGSSEIYAHNHIHSA